MAYLSSDLFLKQKYRHNGNDGLFTWCNLVKQSICCLGKLEFLDLKWNISKNSMIISCSKGMVITMMDMKMHMHEANN